MVFKCKRFAPQKCQVYMFSLQVANYCILHVSRHDQLEIECQYNYVIKLFALLLFGLQETLYVIAVSRTEKKKRKTSSKDG